MSTSIQAKPAFKHPSGSTPLWAHLLRRDISTLPVDPGPTITPAAPLDKNGTSMRMLLHDTQANFEKFSERVDKLTRGVDDAKKEVVLVKQLFQQEHEQLEKDMVDLVNRCQTQIQRSVGEPAQVQKVEDLRKDIQSTDLRLDFLDKRISDLHMLTQTQSQTLQTQSQALQTLQDQQGQILTSLLPLLPLLQAVPLHIESARTNIKELLLEIQIQTSHPVIAPVFDKPPQVGKRSGSTLHSDAPLSSPADASVGRKRPRIESEAVPAIRRQEFQPSPTLASIPLQIQPRSYHAPLNRHHTTQLNQPQSRRFRSPLSNIPLTYGKKSFAAAFPVQQQAPQTPRLPLRDLPTPTDNTRDDGPLSNSLTSQIQEKRPSLIVTTPSPSLAPAFTPSNQRPLRTLRALPSTSNDAETSNSTKLRNRFTNKEPERPSHVNDLFSTNTLHVQQTRQSKTSSVIPQGPQTSLQAEISNKRPPFSSGNEIKSSVGSSTRHSDEAPVSRNDDGASAIAGNLILVPSAVDPAPNVKPMSIKDRRASFRNAHKRFIPLDDDDEDDEE